VLEVEPGTSGCGFWIHLNTKTTKRQRVLICRAQAHRPVPMRLGFCSLFILRPLTSFWSSLPRVSGIVRKKRAPSTLSPVDLLLTLKVDVWLQSEASRGTGVQANTLYVWQMRHLCSSRTVVVDLLLDVQSLGNGVTNPSAHWREMKVRDTVVPQRDV